MAKYVYWNENLDGKHVGDCVTRAITLASGLPYETIQRKLWLTGELFDCDCLCRFCYEHFIEDVLGYRKVNCENLTVGEFADKYPVGTYLIRVPEHLTCVIDNKIMDTWNCSEEPCDIVWKVR